MEGSKIFCNASNMGKRTTRSKRKIKDVARSAGYAITSSRTRNSRGNHAYCRAHKAVPYTTHLRIVAKRQRVQVPCSSQTVSNRLVHLMDPKFGTGASMLLSFVVVLPHSWRSGHRFASGAGGDVLVQTDDSKCNGQEALLVGQESAREVRARF